MLDQKCSLLIPKDAMNWGPFHRATHRTRRCRQSDHHNRESWEELISEFEVIETPCIPVTGLEFCHQSPTGIGDICTVASTLRYFVNQPGIDGAESQVSDVCSAMSILGMVQEPGEFRAREIGIENQAGALAETWLQAFVFECFAERRRSAALPDDGVVYGTTRISIPEHCRFPLVGYPDGSDLVPGSRDRI